MTSQYTVTISESVVGTPIINSQLITGDTINHVIASVVVELTSQTQYQSFQFEPPNLPSSNFTGSSIVPGTAILTYNNGGSYILAGNIAPVSGTKRLEFTTDAGEGTYLVSMFYSYTA
jgi:hypothetical protein